MFLFVENRCIVISYAYIGIEKRNEKRGRKIEEKQI